jgi:hypothetical protein
MPTVIVEYKSNCTFSINFRCQIENQVSDYRLLGASSSFMPTMYSTITIGIKELEAPRIVQLDLYSTITVGIKELEEFLYANGDR